LSIKNLINQD